MIIEYKNFVLVALNEAKQIGSTRLFSVLSNLAANFSVKSNKSIGSARISLRNRKYLIEVSPIFLKEYIHTPTDALHLLLHEIIHKVRGDLVRDVQEQKLHSGVLNLAMDIFVDSLQMKVCFPAGAPYMEKLYPPDQYPANILLTPTQLFKSWALKKKSAAEYAVPYDKLTEILQTDPIAYKRMTFILESIFRDCRCPRPAAIAKLYAVGWLGWAVFNNYLEKLVEVLKDQSQWLASSVDTIIFLGDHGKKGLIFNNGIDLPNALSNLFSIYGGIGKDIKDDIITPVKKIQRVEFFEAVKKAIAPSAATNRSNRGLNTERGIVPFPGRREAFMLSLGCPPTFYPNWVNKQYEIEEQTQLYIDVSASTDSVQPFLYGLAIHLEDAISEPIHLFSNQVEDISVSQLKKGIKKTTGGTDFECVFEHALNHNLEKILIVTDGYATLKDEMKEKAIKTGLKTFVVLTVENMYYRSMFEKFVEKIWVLPKMD